MPTVSDRYWPWPTFHAFSKFLVYLFNIYILSHDSGRILQFHIGRPCARTSSVVLSICLLLFFCFQKITWVNINGFTPNLVCALILWRSGLEMLIGKFRQFLTQLSAHNTNVSGVDICLHPEQWAYNCCFVTQSSVHIRCFFFNQKLLIYFVFLYKNILYGSSLDAPHWGASNEYSQHMFSWRNKKIFSWYHFLSRAQLFKASLA